MSTSSPPAGASAPALELKGVSKDYSGTQVLHEVALSVPRGQIHCLLGTNGSGKSTVVKLLAGVVKGDSGGSISVGGQTIGSDEMTPARARDLGMRFVHQQPAIFPALSVEDNLALDGRYPHRAWGAIDRRHVRESATETLEAFDLRIEPKTPVAKLSPVARTMLTIVRTLREGETEGDVGLLVLDEPTASLPADQVHHVTEVLKECARRGQAILYVTHKLDEVLELADSATVLRDGFVGARLVRAEIAKETLVRHIVGRDVEHQALGRVSERTEEPLVEVEDLHSGPLQGVSMDLWRGEVVGVAGLLGSGKSRLLRTLFGVIRPQAGALRVDGRAVDLRSPHDAVALGIAYVPEDRGRDAALADLTVRENISVAGLRRFWRHGWMSRRRELRATNDAIERFLVKTSGPGQVMSRLSGGNQQKAVLARWLETAPQVLLLDEPTQGVDVGARADIYGLIRSAAEAGAVALVASSDHDELAQLCDRVVVLRPGQSVLHVSGPDLTKETLTHLTYSTHPPSDISETVQ